MNITAIVTFCKGIAKSLGNAAGFFGSLTSVPLTCHSDLLPMIRPRIIHAMDCNL